MIGTTVRPGNDLFLDEVLDPGSFTDWDEPLRELPCEVHYRDELARAREKTGRDESILTGSGLIAGQRVAVVVGDFRFLGGSLGANAAQRVRKAFLRAARERIPLIASPASGGTRMQEGTRAFVQMAAIASAANQHKAAGLPYLAYLRNPTMGGVFASWALQAHITVGEPDALLGFLGPKVYAALTGEEFPAGIQTAEHLHDHGILDAVLERSAFRDYAARFLRLWDLGRRTAQCPLPLSSAATTDPGGTPPTMSANAWSAVEKTRESSRPGVSELLSSAASEVHLLSPAGPPRSAGTIRTALANFGGLPAVLVGTDRRLAATGASLSTGAFAAARRAMDLAENLRLPLVTVIDTAGAELSAQAEEDGIAREISRTLSRMLELRTPTVAVLLGEGTGGGALALFPADRVIAASSAWLAPLPPEGASAIRYGDTAHAAEIATSQRVSAACMLEDGLVDETFPEEPHDRGGSPEFLEHLGHGIAIALADTAQLSAEIRLRRRELKYSEPGTA